MGAVLSLSQRERKLVALNANGTNAPQKPNGFHLSSLGYKFGYPNRQVHNSVLETTTNGPIVSHPPLATITDGAKVPVNYHPLPLHHQHHSNVVMQPLPGQTNPPLPPPSTKKTLLLFGWSKHFSMSSRRKQTKATKQRLPAEQLMQQSDNITAGPKFNETIELKSKSFIQISNEDKSNDTRSTSGHHVTNNNNSDQANSPLHSILLSSESRTSLCRGVSDDSCNGSTTGLVHLRQQSSVDSGNAESLADSIRSISFHDQPEQPESAKIKSIKNQISSSLRRQQTAPAVATTSGARSIGNALKSNVVRPLPHTTSSDLINDFNRLINVESGIGNSVMIATVADKATVAAIGLPCTTSVSQLPPPQLKNGLLFAGNCFNTTAMATHPTQHLQQQLNCTSTVINNNNSNHYHSHHQLSNTEINDALACALNSNTNALRNSSNDNFINNNLNLAGQPNCAYAVNQLQQSLDFNPSSSSSFVVNPLVSSNVVVNGELTGNAIINLTTCNRAGRPMIPAFNPLLNGQPMSNSNLPPPATNMNGVGTQSKTIIQVKLWDFIIQ